MSDASPDKLPALSRRVQIAIAVLLVIVVSVAGFVLRARSVGVGGTASNPRPEAKRALQLTPAQLAAITVEPVAEQLFQNEVVTEGKIAVDEDRTTPIFSPYSGRVIKLFATAGMTIHAGQLLFTIEAPDMVQAQNDLISGISAQNKAQSQLTLAKIVEKRQRELFEARAIALKELQQAQNELTAAQSDLRTAEIGLQAVRNRLRLLGKTDNEIAAFQERGVISPETPIYSPIGGTIVQRKIGPGQFVSSGSSEPAYTVGDLSNVWLTANVRESDASRVMLGQKVEFRVIAQPDRTFSGAISYISSQIDSSSRRIVVRAEIPNPEGLLKPEMFAHVRLLDSNPQTSAAVRREAVIYEGARARVWVVRPDNTLELREVIPGSVSGGYLQVRRGVVAGERVVTKGSLFIDRAASDEG